MKILLVVDHTSHSEMAVRRIAEQAWPPNTTVRVLMVIKRLAPPAATLWHDAGGNLDRVWMRMRYRAMQRVEDLAASLKGGGLKVETVVRDKELPSTILDEANRWSAHRLVVGLHSLTGIKRRLFELAFRFMSKTLDEDPEQETKKAA
jgi:nucleotide-binding universal stress UspA family protein